LAIFIFIREPGISAESCEALAAFRILVSMSAIGSVIVISATPYRLTPWNLSNYQLDLTTPGISPLEAIFLKQIRHIPNFLRNARLLPQIGHLL
jgi:hypothetical protein